jgi:hypothetical protein
MNGRKTLIIKRKKLTLPKKPTATTDVPTAEKPTLSLGSKKRTVVKKSTLSLGKKATDAKKSTLSVGNKSTPAKKPKKAKVAPPPPAEPKEIVVEESAASKAEKIDKELMESFEVWVNYLPLSIGIKKVMSKELEFKRKYSVNAIKLLLTEHTSKKKYLQNIIDGEERQNFKGEVTHTITDEQKEAAQARLDEEDFIA